MESQADFDSGICAVMHESNGTMLGSGVTCEHVDVNDVEFNNVENEELVAHFVDVHGDVPKLRVYVHAFFAFLYSEIDISTW